jgi:hypothetical protein
VKRVALLPLAALLGACATASGGPDRAAFAVPQPTGDPLADSALLLAAAEAAPDAAARAPLVARLDAAGVRAAEGTEDDPLAAWRAEAAAAGAPIYRGRALGPAYRRARLAPGATLRLEQIFLAGERAEIAAAAGGAADLVLSVRDRRNEAVCSAEFRPAATCRWLPLFTERFAIELENRSGAPANVYIVFR